MVFMRLFVENGLIGHFSPGNTNSMGTFEFYQTNTLTFNLLVIIM